MHEFPWLSDDDLPGATPQARMRARTSSRPQATVAHDSGADEQIPEVIESSAEVAPEACGDASGDEVVPKYGAENAMKELADVREELAWEGGDPIFFYTRVLGGRWAKENKGEAADGCSGFARSARPLLAARSMDFHGKRPSRSGNSGGKLLPSSPGSTAGAASTLQSVLGLSGGGLRVRRDACRDV